VVPGRGAVAAVSDLFTETPKQKSEGSNMRIVELRAENIKKLSVVEIRPTGDLVQITGKNGAGKSSVLDAIWWALAGTKPIQSQPIRKGSSKALIKLDLGDIRVTRKFQEGKDSTIVVENADGARYPGPQEMLNTLLGSLTFDPLGFSRMEPAAQLNQLRRLVKVDVDVDALDKANKTDFDKRTDVNREAKSFRAQADGIAVPEGLPDEAIDLSAMLQQMQTAGEQNATLEQRKANRQRVGDQISTDRMRAKDLREDAQALRRKADEMEALARTTDERADLEQRRLDEADPLPAPIDTEKVRQSIEVARVTNAGVEARERKAAIAKEADDKEAEAQALTDAIEARTKQKADAIAAAKMPVDGLGFGDGEVTFKGLPLDQASSAEQLRISCAIAMAANPKLRILRIKDGSLLDDDGLALLGEMAAANDFQIWIERVSSDGKVGIVLEDGHIVGADDHAEAAE